MDGQKYEWKIWVEFRAVSSKNFKIEGNSESIHIGILEEFLPEKQN
jgi:hypothetical protein